MPVAIQPAKHVMIQSLLDSGLTGPQVARKAQVSLSTVERYRKVKPAVTPTITLVERTKQNVVPYLYTIIDKLYKSLTPEKFEKSSMLQVMTGLAIAIDKVRLIQGLSTENVSVYSQASGQLRSVLEGKASVVGNRESIEAGGGMPALPGDKHSISLDSPIANSHNTKDIPNPLKDNNLSVDGPPMNSGDNIGKISLDTKGKPHELVAVHKSEDDELWKRASAEVKEREDKEKKSQAKMVILDELKKHELDPVAEKEFKKLLENL